MTSSTPLLHLKLDVYVPNMILYKVNNRKSLPVVQKIVIEGGQSLLKVISMTSKKTFCLTSNANIFQLVQSNVPKCSPHFYTTLVQDPMVTFAKDLFCIILC